MCLSNGPRVVSITIHQTLPYWITSRNKGKSYIRDCIIRLVILDFTFNGILAYFSHVRIELSFGATTGVLLFVIIDIIDVTMSSFYAKFFCIVMGIGMYAVMRALKASFWMTRAKQDCDIRVSLRHRLKSLIL